MDFMDIAHNLQGRVLEIMEEGRAHKGVASIAMKCMVRRRLCRIGKLCS